MLERVYLRAQRDSGDLLRDANRSTRRVGGIAPKCKEMIVGKPPSFFLRTRTYKVTAPFHGFFSFISFQRWNGK